MKQLPLIPDSNDFEEIPLPLIVAQRWNFPLAYHETENGKVYAVQDWICGLLGVNYNDIRQNLSLICKNNPQFNIQIRKLPYKASDNKIYQRRYSDEDGLIFVLVYSRLSRGRNRLVEIRNFLADSSPKFEYLRCRNIQALFVNESEFQSKFIKVYSLNFERDEIYPYYRTQMGRVVDIFIQHRLSRNKFINLLVECKVQEKDFFKAIGQLIAYQGELSQPISHANWLLAIAIPYKIIDNYMRSIIPKLPIRLISILNGEIIDIATGEPFAKIIGRQAEETSLLMEMDLATGKPLLPSS